MTLSILLEQKGDKRIFRLEGRLDDLAVASLVKEIESSFAMHHRKILLDLTGIEDISEQSIQLLFAETKKFKEGKGCLGLSNASSALLEKLTNAGLGLIIFSDEQTALKAMSWG